MTDYKRDKIIGSMAAFFYVLAATSQSAEAIFLQALFFGVAVYFFRRAHIEEKKIFGKDPDEKTKRRRLYFVLAAVYGFVILVFIISRFHQN